MRKIRDLNKIVYFEAVARLSRVNTAADELAVTPSAVSQRIRSLEADMGVRLFRRVKRRLVLTEEGERFFSAATRSLSILHKAQLELSRGRTARTLVIRVAASFGQSWLAPRVADFVARHPEWDIHVDATPELTDFEAEKVDLEIRYDPDPPPGLHSRLLVTDRVLPMRTPPTKDVENPNLDETFAATRLIHTVKSRVSWRWWLDQHGLPNVDSNTGLKFDRSSMTLRAAADGLGVALETATHAFDELKAGSLQPLVPWLGTVDFPAYHLVCPARHLNRRAVRSFIDWISEAAAAHEEDRDKLLKSLGCEARIPFTTE